MSKRYSGKSFKDSSVKKKPKFSFKMGVKVFTKWVLSQEINEDNLDGSLAEMRKKGLLK